MSINPTDSVDSPSRVRCVTASLSGGLVTTVLSSESLTRFNFEIPSEPELYDLSSNDLKVLIKQILSSDGLEIVLASGQINLLQQVSADDAYITKPMKRSIVPIIVEYKVTRNQIRDSMGQFPPFDLAEQERELMPQIRAILDDVSNREFVSSREWGLLSKCRNSVDVQHCSLDFYSMRTVRNKIFPQVEKRKAFNANIALVSTRADAGENIATVMPDIIQAVKQVSEFKAGDLYPWLDSNLNKLRGLIAGLPERDRIQFSKAYIDFIYKESRLRQAQYASGEAESNLLDILLTGVPVNQDSIIDTLEDALLCKGGIRLTASDSIQRAVSALRLFSESTRALLALERFYSYFSGVNREFLGNAELVAQVGDYLIERGSATAADIKERRKLGVQLETIQRAVAQLVDQQNGLQKIVDRLDAVNQIRELWNKGVLPLKGQIEDRCPDLLSKAMREFGSWKVFLEISKIPSIFLQNYGRGVAGHLTAVDAYYDKVRTATLIEKFHERGESLSFENVWAKKRILIFAGIKHFGTWPRAVKEIVDINIGMPELGELTAGDIEKITVFDKKQLGQIQDEE